MENIFEFSDTYEIRCFLLYDILSFFGNMEDNFAISDTSLRQKSRTHAI